MGYRFQTAQEIALATDRWVRRNKLPNTGEDTCRRWIFSGTTDLLCYWRKDKECVYIPSIGRNRGYVQHL